MARLMAFYKTPKDTATFDAYYAATHVPLAKTLPGLRAYDISSGEISGEGVASYANGLTYEGAFLGFYNIGCLREPQIDPPTDSDPSERDASYQRIARDYIGDNVGDLPRVVAARVGRLWHVYQIDQGLRLDGYIEGRSGGPPGSSLVFVRAALWSYYVLVVLAMVGGVVAFRRRIPLSPLVAQVLLATFTAATTFGVTRYRAGAEIAVVVLAAVAIDRLVTTVRARSSDEEALVGVQG